MTGEAVVPSEALDIAVRTRPEIMLLDLKDVDEFLAVLKVVRRRLPGTRVICLADHPTEEETSAVLAGGATGMALKTDSADLLISVLKGTSNGQTTLTPDITESIIQHYHEVIQEKRLRDAAVIQALASAVEAKDSETGLHIQRVSSVARALAMTLDPALGSNRPLQYGFVLHDVGKIGVPESILKKEAALSIEEWAVMKTHPVIGLQIIAPIEIGSDAEDVVRHHHERWDGNGYPDGLSGEGIPLAARIFAVADAFDAMTHDRPYRIGLSQEIALKELSARAGSQFDPEIVDGFMKMVVAGTASL